MFYEFKKKKKRNIWIHFSYSPCILHGPGYIMYFDIADGHMFIMIQRIRALLKQCWYLRVELCAGPVAEAAGCAGSH